MIPNRFTSVQSSGMRKSRLEGKASLLPLPRRPGSTDRLSSEARRPSVTGLRSSSAEPARGTFGGARFSREASATKLPLNRRSRSQTGEAKYGPTATPLRTNPYSRPTTTPVRTPSKDRETRSWQSSLERALAFVTIKDQRPVSSAAWQRAEGARVAEALGARGQAGALVRPLTIARFVDIVGALLAPLSTRDARLNTDNYVTKLPHLLKRLLYPGALSKSWLRTVNTLHAFPHALALIAYLLDLVSHVEMPVLDEWLYIEKDELACLRRDYLYKCWIRFQEPNIQYDDLNQEYLQNLRNLLGNNDEKIAELQQIIKKYEACLEDEVERAARADEARRVGRRDALLLGLRAERSARAAAASDLRAVRTAAADCTQQLQALHTDIERASAVLEQLSREVEQQPLSLAQWTALSEQLEYAHQVLRSKQALADNIAKMVCSKEAELVSWQRLALESCVQYKQRLIHLAAHCPALADLALDEKELMEAECVSRVSAAVEALRAEAARLTSRRAAHARQRTALSRRRANMLEETRAKIVEMKAAVEREQSALDAESQREAAEAQAWGSDELAVLRRLEELRGHHEQYARVDAELELWEAQDCEWKTRLAQLKNYIEEQKVESKRVMEEAIAKRVNLVTDHLRKCNLKLDELTSP